MDWYPQKIISGEEPFALLILNQTFEEEERLFIEKRWKSALFHVAVDGGANQLMKLSKKSCDFLPDSKKSCDFLPDLVCGDFDSVTPEVLEFYKSQGVKIIETPDQDETDFTKALRLTEQLLNDANIKVSFILAVVKNGDRLDHLLGNLNTLFQSNDITSIPLFILGHQSLTWLLHAGQHKIHITEKMLDSYVGLIPIGRECTDVTTTGLKWNMNHGKMEFGGLISICNRFDGSESVTITTDTPLIWTMEIKISYV